MQRMGTSQDAAGWGWCGGMEMVNPNKVGAEGNAKHTGFQAKWGGLATLKATHLCEACEAPHHVKHRQPVAPDLQLFEPAQTKQSQGQGRYNWLAPLRFPPQGWRKTHTCLHPCSSLLPAAPDSKTACQPLTSIPHARRRVRRSPYEAPASLGSHTPQAHLVQVC